MSKSLENASPRIRESYKRVQEARQKNNPDYAIELLQAILEVQPALDDFRRELREIQLGKLTRSKPDSMAPLKAMGKTMAVKKAIKKEPAKALALAEELLAIDPIQPSFLELYCEAAKAAETPSAAVITLEEVLKKDPKNEDLLEKLGKLYLQVGNAKKARATFERLGDLRPEDQTVIKWIKDTSAMDSMARDGWEEEGDFRGKLKSEEESSDLEQAGRSQQGSNDLGRMIEKQRKKLEQEPDNLNLYRPLADSLSKNGDLAEALEVLQQADEKANHADPMVQRAITETTVKIYDHNIRVLQEEGDPEAAEEQRREKENFLLEDAQDKVKRYPNDLGFKFEYGRLLFDRGDLDTAIAQFQQAQRNPQRRIEALYYMGSCFKAKGQYDIAADQLQRAAEELPSMDGQKIAILYELGEVLEAQGEWDNALAEFKKIYAVDIGYKDVAQKIESGYQKKKNQQADG